MSPALDDLRPVRAARATGQRHPAHEPGGVRTAGARQRAGRRPRRRREVIEAARTHAPEELSLELEAPCRSPRSRLTATSSGRCLRTSSATRSSTRPARAGSRFGSSSADRAPPIGVRDQGVGIPAPEQPADLREVLPPRPEHGPRRERHGSRPLHLPRARPAHGGQHLGRIRR